MGTPARYPSECPECGSRIRTGDLIARDDDDEDWVHVSCSDAAPTPERPCPHCFLTICDCDKDL